MTPTLNELINLAIMALTNGGNVARSKNAVGRISTAAIYAAGTGVAAIAVLGCLMAALWLYVRPHVGAGGGALIVAVAIVILWLALLVFTRRTDASRKGPPPRSREDISVFITEGQHLFEKNKGAVLLTAVIAGIVAGNTGRRTSADR